MVTLQHPQCTIGFVDDLTEDTDFVLDTQYLNRDFGSIHPKKRKLSQQIKLHFFLKWTHDLMFSSKVFIHSNQFLVPFELLLPWHFDFMWSQQCQPLDWITTILKFSYFAVLDVPIFVNWRWLCG